jgi:hypothetical protein
VTVVYGMGTAAAIGRRMWKEESAVNANCSVSGSMAERIEGVGRWPFDVAKVSFNCDRRSIPAFIMPSGFQNVKSLFRRFAGLACDMAQ